MMSQQRNVRFINPSTMAAPPGGYSYVVEVTRGRLVYISGQVALDQSGTLIGIGDFRAQAQQVLENLNAALEGVGGSFDNVIKLNNYLIDMSQLSTYKEVRDTYINTENPPASTTVQVSGLFHPDCMIEVEAIAVLPETE